ncbi:conserved hypothetical protein [Mucor ambiguus]|uniref:EXS domain-containing protein n=1 Tax=Mucor ambiguus TaxID=91626 RepID=A0A0C9LVQ6_9FUNG|nr:conserved hypothetical protein [Mucor ambiguus]
MLLDTAEALTVPESYQPLALICFSLWSWITVLTVSDWQNIDVNALLHTTSPLHKRKPLVVMATGLTLLLTFHVVLLEHAIFKQHTNTLDQFGPVIVCYTVAMALVLYFQDGQRFLKCLGRLMRNCPVYFSDVLVADILISFSGVFTSLCVNLMQAVNMSHSKYAPFITSIPYLIRLKQCLCDYYTQQHPHNSKLINAFKYASSIPVIFLGHHTKPNSSADVFNGITQNNFVWQLWLFSAMFNSAFAFAWDLVMDWGLVQMNTTESTFIRLRKDLYFSDPLYYVAAVGVNGSLRLLKIGSHVFHVHPVCVDVAEIVRRWIWVVFRFENEWLKRSYSSTDVELQQQSVFASANNALHIAPHS